MKVLILNQPFYPDVAAVSQYATDVAKTLAANGHSVTVLASRRGYDDPQIKFPPRAQWTGIRIIRVPCSGFGKKAKWLRLLDFSSFIASCVARLVFLRRFDVVIGMTAPPLIASIAALFVRWRGGRFVYWVMDLNPDLAIAAGLLSRRSLIAKIFESILRFTLRQAAVIVVLDEFMKANLISRGVSEERITIIPPWSLDDNIRYDDSGRAAFRERFNLSDKYVVMYSGNHSPYHPVGSLLKAACRLAGEPEIAFCFVGGGSDFSTVRNFASNRNLTNITCVPYQPIETLASSLSAADLHVVILGDSLVGIVHPCKVYNILAVGIPLLYIGPDRSHIVEMIPPSLVGSFARFAKHGDVDSIVAAILAGKNTRMAAMSQEVSQLAMKFSQGAIMPQFIDIIESAAHLT